MTKIYVCKRLIFLSNNLEHYAIRFIPRENGIHWVHVRFNGRDIPDSPFRVVVGHANADPGRVFASGSGLYQGETGMSYFKLKKKRKNTSD